MTCKAYTEIELRKIRELSQEGITDAEIVVRIRETFGITRTIRSISRKRNRSGITKPKTYHYVKPMEWLPAEKVYVQTYYHTRSDEDIAEWLGRSPSQIQRLRVKQGWLRKERKEVLVEKPKPLNWKPDYLKFEIDSSHIESVMNMRQQRGTYADDATATGRSQPVRYPVCWGRDICWEKSEGPSRGSQGLGRETIRVKQLREEMA